ncbi:hypothetical protein OFEAOIEE_LOCUS2989 [Methylorubrum extorquens]
MIEGRGPFSCSMNNSATGVIRSGHIFPIVRSGRAYGGLTSVLALDPSILFYSQRELNKGF